MRGLIFFMCCPGHIDVCHAVKGECAVKFCLGKVFRCFLVPIIFFQGLHVLMAGCGRVPVFYSSPPCGHLKTGMKEPRKKSLFKSLVTITDLPQLFLDPAFLNKVLEGLEGGL